MTAQPPAPFGSMTWRSVAGGDINHAARVYLPDGRRVFVKWNDAAPAGMFEREQRGLRALERAAPGHVPQVLDYAAGWLQLDWIEPGAWTDTAYERLGRVLATVHSFTADQFGLDHDNFLGPLPQNNDLMDTWGEFWMTSRILPLLRRAQDDGAISGEDAAVVEAAASRVVALCPPERARLIHGDLWSGNAIADDEGRPWLVDPAISYSHREVELAFMRLFGGFDDPFWGAYSELLPIADGFDERCAGLQLYPLLAHTILFGGSYADRLVDAARRY